MKDKRYIIKKYVIAPAAAEALKREHNTTADEVWLDENWHASEQPRTVAGFRTR